MNIVKLLLSWWALAVWAAALAVISWPWANHFVSYFWMIITVAVLIGELINKLWSPKRQTLSNNVQDEGKADPVRFWIHIAAWMAFAITLAGHFCVKLLK
jgi:hypothetical protein